MAIRGGVPVKDKRFHCSRPLGCDRVKQLFREHLYCPLGTQRSAKKVNDRVVRSHNGITRFVRLCHTALSSSRPLSGSNRISPLRAKPAAIGSA